jgi:PAS domain S-box-containing protein
LTRESLRIVHIEDDLNDVQLTDFRLKEAGFTQRIHHFNSCGKALDNLSRIEVAQDVIVIDLNMPGMGGLEMVDWLRKKFREPGIPVCVLTASDDPEDRRKAANAGVTKYFLKTGSFEEVIKELDQLIARINQKRMDQEKKRQATYAELILQGKSAIEMVVLTDTKGRIQWVNESFERMSGYTLDESHGKKLGRMLQGPQSDPDAMQMFRDAFHSARPCEGRIINYKKNGTPYRVFISLRPVFTDGRLDGFLAIEKVLSEEEEQIATAN